MDFILAFFAGWMFSWYSLAALLALCLFSESNDSHYWALLFGGLFGFAAFQASGVSLTGGQIAVAAVLYIPVGIVWSVYRYKRHIAKLITTIGDFSASAKRDVMKRNAPERMTESFVAWTFLWPVSFIENFVGDIINTVRIAITTYFSGVYRKIYQNAFDSVLPQNMQE